MKNKKLAGKMSRLHQDRCSHQPKEQPSAEEIKLLYDKSEELLKKRNAASQNNGHWHKQPVYKHLDENGNTIYGRNGELIKF